MIEEERTHLKILLQRWLEDTALYTNMPYSAIQDFHAHSAGVEYSGIFALARILHAKQTLEMLEQLTTMLDTLRDKHLEAERLCRGVALWWIRKEAAPERDGRIQDAYIAYDTLVRFFELM